MTDTDRAPDVAAWLERLGLGQYASAFAENHIDLELLPRLGADDLKDLGVASVGHRKRLLASIAELPNPAGAAEAAPDDDPVRAARAALDIHAGIAELGQRYGRNLAVHLGIASGEVLAGGLAGDAKQEQRRAARERALGEALIAREQALFLDDLLDIAPTTDAHALYDAMDNERRNLGKRQTVATLVANASAREPRLIAVEDVHWADTLTLRHLAGIAAALRDAPVLLLLSTRVEGDPLDGAWRMGTGGTPLTTIDVGPLLPDESKLLAATFTVATDRVALACVDRAAERPRSLRASITSEAIFSFHSVASTTAAPSTSSDCATRSSQAPRKPKRARWTDSATQPMRRGACAPPTGTSVVA